MFEITLYNSLALILLSVTFLELANQKPQIRGRSARTPVNDSRHM